MNKGITTPNRQYDDYTKAEIDALMDLNPDTILWILYGGEIDQRHEAQLTPFITAHTHLKIIYRPYADDIPLLEPTSWADECMMRVEAMTYIGEVICDNERNLAVEHGNENWKAQATWLVRWATRMGRKYTIHMGALSPSGHYEDGIRYFLDHGTYNYFDVADWHVYTSAQLEVAYKYASRLRTTMTSIISEFNRIPVAPLLDTRYTRTNGTIFQFTDGIWFILGGMPDQATYDIMLPNNAAYYHDFKTYENASPGPTPTPVGFNVGTGVKNLMERNGDSPDDDEQYMNNVNGVMFGSETAGKKGTYKWNKRSGRVSFTPYGDVP